MVSKDPDDYRYAPPPARTAAVGRVLVFFAHAVGTVGLVLMVLRALNVL